MTFEIDKTSATFTAITVELLDEKSRRFYVTVENGAITDMKAYRENDGNPFWTVVGERQGLQLTQYVEEQLVAIYETTLGELSAIRRMVVRQNKQAANQMEIFRWARTEQARASLLEKFEKLASEMDMEVSDIIPTEMPTPAKKPAPTRSGVSYDVYRDKTFTHPETNATWIYSGRGRVPLWVMALEESLKEETLETA